MSRIRSKNTLPERDVFAYLRKQKITFKKHYEKLPGRPDIVIPKKKKVVFIDGDFWHGWRFPQWSHKLSSDFWREKISDNIQRDKKNFAKLRREGWKVLRVWDHELSTNKKREKTLRRIYKFLV